MRHTQVGNNSLVNTSSVSKEIRIKPLWNRIMNGTATSSLFKIYLDITEKKKGILQQQQIVIY